ncbi:tandem-95 repeat protein [Nocardioides agariphilus]|jgi:hypothetical protein|uniref:Tandem-95 repeat protein n=1 Tax=Nocardioides agariphilus TaxID=433664 RepID=A0A930VN25_9ACTN|nr:Ig-like domain-containing protein [Nocardioides agariphilus]MBF4767676.1 tandem-95 repeat protein [Nocardioides agariphilus]
MVATLLAWVSTAPPAVAEEPTGTVACGYGFVCNGDGSVSGDIAPLTVTGLDPWNRIVQKPAAVAWYSLEAQATALVAALHGVPNDRRLKLSARGEIRAMMFSLLLNAIDKPSEQRTTQEQQWLTTLQAVVKQRRIDVATKALDEYHRWDANPCTFSPPFSYTTPPVTPQCALGGGGQLTTIAGTSWDSPPTFAQFQAYGAALANNADFGTVDAAAAVADTTAAITFFAGAAAAGVLAAVAAVIAGTVPAVAAAVGAAIGSGIALTATMTTASSMGGAAATLGTSVLAASAFAGTVAVAIVGIIVIAIRSWQISEALSLPKKLSKAVYDAQNQGISLAGILENDCGDGPDGCGTLELYSALLSQTLPDYAAERAAAAAQTPPVLKASDPYFELFDQAGNSLGDFHTINPQGSDALSMSDNWFVLEDFFNPGRYTLQTTYIDWSGTQRVVSIHGRGFVTRTAFGKDTTNVVECFELMALGEKVKACWRGPHAPKVVPTVTVNPVEGSPVTFQANATDEDGGPLSYLWVFDDPVGSFNVCVDFLGEEEQCSTPRRTATTPEVTLTYPNDGVQHARVTVTDATGLSTTETIAFKVGNAAPSVTLDPASPATITAGDTTTLTGTVSDVGHDDITLTVDWGDGTTTTEQISTCSCLDPNEWDSLPLGTRSFELTHRYVDDPQGVDNVFHPKVTASDGADTASATTPVGVTPGTIRLWLANEEDPGGGVVLPTSGDRRDSVEGQDDDKPVELNGWVSIPGPFFIRVEWGDTYSSFARCDPDEPGQCLVLDGNKPDGLPLLICPCTGGFFHFDHFYADGPSRPQITVTVTDDDGRVVTARTSADVANVAPTVRFTDGGAATGTARAGEPYALQAALYDPGDDTFVSSIDWGDGSAPTDCLALDCLWPWIDGEHTYDGPGRFEVTVKVTDDDGGTGQIVRTLDVEPAGNVAPTAADRSATTDEDTPVTVTPLGHDANGDDLTFTVTQPGHGSVEVTDEGLVYTPGADFFGNDSFTYTAHDAELSSEPATVSVTVDPVDDPADAADTEVETDEDESVVVDPSATDPEGDPVTFELLTAPAHGTLQGTEAPWTYVPDADYHGSDEFDYAVKSGGQLVVRTALITVLPVNDRPTAQDASEETAEDTPLVFTPETDDVDGDDLTLVIVDQPSHGTAEVTASGALRYVPAADHSGPDSFTYRASDGQLTSAVATASITVTGVNDAPTVEPVDRVTATYSDPITPVVLTASDAETPDRLVFSAEGLPEGLTIDGTGKISGRPTATPASYSVQVRVCDPDEACAGTAFVIDVQPETAVVRLTPNNPHAVATDKGTAPAITFTGRVTDSNDGSFGDIGRIVAASVSLRLTPVGGGGTVTCTPSITKRVAATPTAPGFVDISCTVPTGTKIDVYDVTLAVSGHFTGSDASLLSVYDPRARGANGAGSVLLANGNSGEFAFSAAASGKTAKGKVAFLERSPSGDVVTQVKGTAFQTLVVGTGSPLPAALTGKAVVNGIGNYAYVVNVADGGANGDTFALRVTAPAGAPSLPSLSFAALPVRPGGAISVH